MSLIKYLLKDDFNNNDKEKNVIPCECPEYISVKKTFIAALDNHFETEHIRLRRLEQFFEQLKTVVENFDAYKEEE